TSGHHGRVDTALREQRVQPCPVKTTPARLPQHEFVRSHRDPLPRLQSPRGGKLFPVAAQFWHHLGSRRVRNHQRCPRGKLGAPDTVHIVPIIKPHNVHDRPASGTKRRLQRTHRRHHSRRPGNRTYTTRD